MVRVWTLQPPHAPETDPSDPLDEHQGKRGSPARRPTISFYNLATASSAAFTSWYAIGDAVKAG